jgi:hypothetical protein
MRRLRSTGAAAAGGPTSAAERTASTSASGPRRASREADLRSGKARGWVGEVARSSRREEARLSAVLVAPAAGNLANCRETGSGDSGGGVEADVVVVEATVQSWRRRTRAETAARRPGGRMVAGKGLPEKRRVWQRQLGESCCEKALSCLIEIVVKCGLCKELNFNYINIRNLK